MVADDRNHRVGMHRALSSDQLRNNRVDPLKHRLGGGRVWALAMLLMIERRQIDRRKFWLMFRNQLDCEATPVFVGSDTFIDSRSITFSQ